MSVKQTTTPTMKIYRFKFDDVILDEMMRFAKMHSHDDRVTFKESWELWKDEQRPLIEREKTRLNELGYDGDIYKKIYKSVRYYYAKKSNKTEEPCERRKYISIHKNIIKLMDEHIASQYVLDDFKPSDAFNVFTTEHETMLKDEYTSIMSNHTISKEDVLLKFKKTYKNRYFIYRKNL